jgi:hypothetical protein
LDAPQQSKNLSRRESVAPSPRTRNNLQKRVSKVENANFEKQAAQITPTPK